MAAIVNPSSLKKILRKQNMLLLSGTLMALVLGIVAAGVFSTLNNYHSRVEQLDERIKALNSIFVREALVHSYHTIDFELTRLQNDFHLQSIVFGERAQTAATCGVNSGTLRSWPIAYGTEIVGCVEAKLEPLDLGFKIDASLLTPVGLTAIVMSLLLMGYRRSMLRALITPIQDLHNQAEAIGGIKGVFKLQSNVDEFKRLEVMLNQMLVRVNESTLKVAEYEREASKLQIARQVAHDIRSPLSALMMLTGNVPELSEPKLLLLRNAVSRINDIANSLRSKSHVTKEPELQIESLAFCIEEIVSEKRSMTDRLGVPLQFDVKPEHFNIFSLIQPSEFKRVLSNIINNAIEAIDDHGSITVELRPSAPKMNTLASSPRVEVVIRDTGCGIPEEVIGRVFDNSFSYNKPNGSGLGLFHAREQIRQFKGDISISSIESVGTTVTIELPLTDPPSFWCREIQTSELKRAVIIDDSQSVHDVWRARLTDAGGAVVGARRSDTKFLIESIFSVDDFISRIRESSVRPDGNDTLFLVDFEYSGSSKTGLDAIAQISQAVRLTNVVLVTSHAHELPIVNRCKELGVRLLPKSLISLVPIRSAEGHHVVSAPPAITPIASNIVRRK